MDFFFKFLNPELWTEFSLVKSSLKNFNQKIKNFQFPLPQFFVSESFFLTGLTISKIF